MGQKVFVCKFQAHFKSDLCLPVQRVKTGAVHELARRTIGLGRVGVNGAGVAHGAGHGLCHFQDAHVFAAAHVDVAEHGLGMLAIGELGQIHDVHACCCHVIYIQEFSLGCTRAPDGDAGCVVDLSFRRCCQASMNALFAMEAKLNSQ